MTDAELTILSLVAEGAQYGHDIQQIIDARGLREWVTIGFSSVYYILNRLEQQNLVQSTLQMEGKRAASKAYTITEAGWGVLQTAISDLLRQPRSLGTGFELGLANLFVLKPHQVYNVLSNHHEDLARRLQAVERSWEEHQKNNQSEVHVHIGALYTHSMAIMSAELEWLTGFLSEWKRRYPAVDKNVPGKRSTDTPASPDETRIHYHATQDPAQMIQRLKRPCPQTGSQTGEDSNDSTETLVSRKPPKP